MIESAHLPSKVNSSIFWFQALKVVRLPKKPVLSPMASRSQKWIMSPLKTIPSHPIKKDPTCRETSVI